MPAPQIDGVVQSVNPELGLVVLSVGADDGVKVGHEFVVYRRERESVWPRAVARGDSITAGQNKNTKRRLEITSRANEQFKMLLSLGEARGIAEIEGGTLVPTGPDDPRLSFFVYMRETDAYANGDFNSPRAIGLSTTGQTGVAPTTTNVFATPAALSGLVP